MKIRHITTCLAILIAGSIISAQESSQKLEYRRSSICSFLVSRLDQKMYDRIQQKYIEIPTPDKYNDHNLSIRMINVGKKGNYADSISNWLDNNKIASRIVAKWYNRNMLTGECNMSLIQERGLYNATEFDKELAARSPRGIAMLADAGEELISNTFVLVHEAHYIDNAKRSQNVSTGLKIGGALLGAFIGVDLSDAFDLLGDLAATFKGFRVKFHSRLYQLVWDEEAQATFYQDYYSANPDSIKRIAFEANRNKFKLKYIGEVESSGSQNSFLGISEENPEIMIRKACQRAIDDNVRDLQKKFEVFRVKSPIIDVLSNNEVLVPIGMKEGVNEDSEYEVLEAIEKDGRIEYKRISTIEPVKDRIWDNRFMAKEEGAYGSDLTATTFKVKSGKTPYPGVLVRQIK